MRYIVCLGLCLVFFCGCEQAKVEESKTNESPTTPVKVITLSKKNPSLDLRLTGTVDTWKQEEISFEVGGKIDYVIDGGADVQGALKNIKGEIIKQGTILAKLDKKIYQLRVESAKADIKALQAQYKTTETEINHVIPAQLAEAKSSLQLAERNYKRLSKLMVTDATSQSDLDQARSSFDGARAKIRQIQAQKKVKEASLLNFDAQLKKLNES